MNSCNQQIIHKINIAFNLNLSMIEAENPMDSDPNLVKIRSYNSSTAEETYQQIMETKVAPKRNLMRLEIIKKRKDFNQPYKFT